MLHLRLDGNEADCKMCVLMPRSPIVFKLETTWKSSEKFCFNLFVYFCAVKVKKRQNYLDICRAMPLKCTPTKRGVLWQKCGTAGWGNLKRLEKLNLIGFPLAYGKPLLFERLNSFEFWIETSAVLTDEIFFRTDNSSCPNAWIFFWTDKPSRSNGIPIDLERMTNSKRTVFSRSNRYPLVYVFVWEVIVKKRLKI